LAHRNSTPPALPMASVSSTRSSSARPGRLEAIEAGIRDTPPYGKSAFAGQMRLCHAAMHIPLSREGEEGCRSADLIPRSISSLPGVRGRRVGWPASLPVGSLWGLTPGIATGAIAVGVMIVVIPAALTGVGMG